MKKFLFAVFLFVSMLSFSQNKFTFSEEDKTILIKRLDFQWDKNFNPELTPGSSIVDLSGFILDAVSVGYNHEKIQTALKYLKNSINLSDKNPKTYGNIFWYHGDTVINDSNGVEFCMRKITLIWILYKDKLSKIEKQTIMDIFKYSIEGIKRHNVKLSYTNIILMKIWNLIALGEYYNKPELAEEGYKFLKEWILYTYKNGFCEYLSPTYYAVDIENLSLIYNFTKNSEAKKIAGAALEYIWSDVASNWYEPSKRLGGTHSRDYDRLYGHNAIDELIEKAGWSSIEERKISANSAYTFYSFVSPKDEIKKYITNPIPRFVYEKWGEDSSQRASNYIGKNFSVGSAEANYYNMDKTPLVINIGSGYDTPVINFFMDGRQDYYGFKKILERSGHEKSLHLKPFITSVQNDGEVLFLASIKDGTDNTERLDSNITIPSDSEIWLNNKKLDIFNAKSLWYLYPSANDETTFFEIKTNDKNSIIKLSDNDKGAGLGIQRQFKITPKNTYKLSACLKGQNINLYINFYDKNNSLIEKEHIKSVQLKKDEFEWEDITEKAPENAVYCKAWVYSSIGGKTEVYINDLKFEDLSGNTPKLLGSFDFKEEIRQGFVVNENDNLFIKREDVVSVIRPVKALDVQGNPVNFELNNDGLQYGAFRLTANHSSLKTGKTGIVSIWSYTEEGITDEKKFENFRKKISAVKSVFSSENNISHVKVSGITGDLQIAFDTRNEKRILRKGMKQGTENSLLSVNGIDIGKKILENLDVVKKSLEK
jgi:hypothetical protein